MNELDAYKSALKRERAARMQAEQILEQKSLQLYNANEELKILYATLEGQYASQSQEIINLMKFYEENPFPMIRLSREGEILFLNSAAEREFELNLFELGNILPDNILESLQPLPRNGTKESKFEMGGKVFYVYTTAILDQNYVHIYSFDVTERINAERRLAESEDKYRNIIENMELGLLEVDNNDRIVRAYDKFCEMTGYTENELIGLIAGDTFLDDEDKRVLKEQIALRKEGVASVYEVQMKHKDGHKTPVLLSGTPIYNIDHKIIGSIGISLDITAQKRIEKELKEAKLKAEESTKVKEQFMANMSHEIRTPLNVILGMSRLLKKQLHTKEQAEYIDAVLISATNLLKIINDILDLSKINSDKFEFEFVTFDLKKLIDEICQAFSFAAKEKGINFLLEYDDQISPYLKSDPLRLNQVLVNLLNNAIKFTTSGEVRFCVKLIAVNEQIEKLCFEIHDTGIGIDEDRIEFVFENFSQEDASISKKFGGTGLGLPICKELIDQFGGELQVKSKKSEGATFWFNLTFERGNSDDVYEPIHIEVNDQVLKGVKILLAEDNQYNQLLTSKVMEMYGAKVTVAENGLETINIVENHNFDIILMDVQMPEMSGIEATRVIRNEYQLDLPIIALTANALKGDRERFLNEGMNDYLSKPFEEEDLLSRVAQQLGLTINTKIAQKDHVVIENQEVAQNKELYSLEKLEKLTHGNKDFMIQLAEKFLATAPITVDEVAQAYEQQDWATVKKLIHRLRGSYNSFGINDLKGDMDSIDNLVFEMNEQERRDKLDHFLSISKTVFERLKKDIDDLRSENS